MVRMVINTDGVPVPRMMEMPPYVQWVLVHLTRSHCDNPFLITFPPLLLEQLQDPNGYIIARLRSVKPTKYTIGDVYRELQYIPSAGAGVVVSSLWAIVHPCLELAPGCRPLRGTLTPRNAARRGSNQQVKILLMNSRPALI